MLSEWFEQVFAKTPNNQTFDAFYIAQQMTQNDVNLRHFSASQLISHQQTSRFAHHLEVKRSCQEQKAFRDSFLKSHTDFDIDLEDGENDEEARLLSIEEAVLIIQKLERKYQAISRRNYVRFVRERAAELHGVKTEIDATQAAIRIQAVRQNIHFSNKKNTRTRGYFARKLVREMRDKELEVLQMKPESIIKLKCMSKHQESVEYEQQKQQQPVTVPIDLETAINELKSNFYLTIDDVDLAVETNIVEKKMRSDTVFLDACFRGIVAALPTIPFERLVSQKETVKIDGKVLNFDLRSFFVLVYCIPMALSTFSATFKQPRWILLTGAQDSGKTAWVKAIAKTCAITHVHISKNVVLHGKRTVYSVAKKLARQESRLIISVDRIDILRDTTATRSKKSYTHRQMLLRTFLLDVAQTGASVFGMARGDELDATTREMFAIHVALTTPTGASRYNLVVDCLARNLEQDRLPKVPHRIFDIEKQTQGLSNGKASKFVTNRWSAANKN